VRLRQQAARGTFVEVAGCDERVMRDDNRSTAVAFEWAHGIRERPDVQANYVWSRSLDVTAYTSLANLCLTPSFLAKLTDTDESIRTLLRYRAFDLLGTSFSRDPPRHRRFPSAPYRPPDTFCGFTAFASASLLSCVT
jgi:hypothetical protein